jgi:hypothetical protein
MITELLKSQEQLKELADLMVDEARDSNTDVVSRYTRMVFNSAQFADGQKSDWNHSQSTFNKENISTGVYNVTEIDNLLPVNFEEATVSRDLQSHTFNFMPKGVPLPTEESVFFEQIPTNAQQYDDELREFSKSHKNVRISRYLTVEERIIVNSRGGKTIQVVPVFGISYSHGYSPIPTERDLSAVCTSDEDIRRMTALIRFLADPTPDKRIKNSRNFSQAFDHLHKISGLKYGSIEDAGIPLSELYDVIMLTGVPIHEIFGHHFEEPIRRLNFGESGAFRFGQSIQNKDILLEDNPDQTIEGFRIRGFTHFDAYGRKREPRVHIKDGKVVGFLGSEYADKQNLKKYLGLEKSPFIGNAYQSIDGFFPQTRMSCTVLDGKTEDINLEGRLLIVSNEGHTQPQDKTYMVKSNECYVIRDGEPKRMIPLQVTGGINQALSNIVLLPDWSYQTGSCGKPEPIYYPDSRGHAQAPVSQFTRNQMWRGQQVYPLPISDNHLKILTNSL